MSYDTIVVTVCSFLGAGIAGIISAWVSYRIARRNEITEKQRETAFKMLHQLELYYSLEEIYSKEVAGLREARGTSNLKI